jgi:hypothetical protein
MELVELVVLETLHLAHQGRSAQELVVAELDPWAAPQHTSVLLVLMVVLVE